MNSLKNSDFFQKVDAYFQSLQLKIEEGITSIEKKFSNEISKPSEKNKVQSFRMLNPSIDEHCQHQEFAIENWLKPKNEKLSGHGRTAMLEIGNVFGRAGIGFSNVQGDSLPQTATERRKDLAGCSFRAHGLSLVFHPVNPYCPTVHFNLRHFEAVRNHSVEAYWFGGGMDLTPCYGFTEDAVHFHRCCQKSLEPSGNGLYKEFKRNCDKYFFLPHRNETRGIGGIFFDDFATGKPDKDFAMIEQIGQHFLPSYLPIIEKRHKTPYGDEELRFQAYRRSRYVEFNLLFDRGTHFGLQSGGRTESILLSMPPIAAWQYQWHPASGSKEEDLYKNFLHPVDWLKVGN